MNETITELGLVGVPVAKPTVAERVIEIIKSGNLMTVSGVVPAARLTDDLGMDSFNYLELVIRIEDEFKIDINDAEAELWSTVNDVIKYVESRMV